MTSCGSATVAMILHTSLAYKDITYRLDSRAVHDGPTYATINTYLEPPSSLPHDSPLSLLYWSRFITMTKMLRQDSP